jgi:predicted PurR-regulated permease PerM
MASKRKIVFYIVLSIFSILMVSFLYAFRVKIIRVLTPFFIAVVIAYLLKPLVERLENKGIPRGAGILLIYLGFMVLTITSVIFLVPELINNTKELMNTLPDIIAEYQSIFSSFISSIKSSKWSKDIKNVLFREIQSAGEGIQAYINRALKRSLTMFIETLTMLFDFLLAMVIAYYLIKDSDYFKSVALSIIPGKWRKGIIATGKEINMVLSKFIQGQLLTAIIVGVLETIGLFLVRVKYPLVLGVIGGIAEIIPYFGPVIGAVPAVAIALIESPIKAMWTVLVYVVVQQLENAYISPKIIEGRLGLHPVATIMVILAGGKFFGVAGMLLAVPVTAILRVLIKRTINAVV